MRYPLSVEVQYRASLRGLAAGTAALVRAELDRDGQAMLDRAAFIRSDDDGPIPGATGWAGLLLQMLLRVTDGILGRTRQTEALIASLSRRTSEVNLSEWKRIVRESYGVDIVRGEPWLADQLSAWEQANLALIRSVPAGMVEQIRQEITQAVSQGTSLRDLKGIVRDRLGVADSRAELIARDQISKLNADLGEKRQRSIGVTQYIWRTVGDERVRPSHRFHDGKTYQWAKPPAGTGHPGRDYRCRCYADPVLPEMTEAEVRLLG